MVFFVLVLLKLKYRNRLIILLSLRLNFFIIKFNIKYFILVKRYFYYII